MVEPELQKTKSNFPGNEGENKKNIYQKKPENGPD